ncbi:hypothetical protein [Aliiruegeria haliotis]|nr:hypothetical protein [Aliiruegeria haliotis]
MADYSHMEFEVKTRLLLPRSRIHVQSLYIFNMYRAGSSLMEAIVESIAAVTPFTAYNIVRALDDAGVSLIDPVDYSRNTLFLDDAFHALDRIADLGGYIYYGFREVPHGYATRFDHVAAAVLLVRDPRDVLISQYSAVAKHVVSGAAGADIMKLREKTENMQREEFITSDESIAFARRIVNCYRPMIEKGMAVLRYEDFFEGSEFQRHRLVETVVDCLADYFPEPPDVEKIAANLEIRIENSKALRGHGTAGTHGMHRSLSRDCQEALVQHLRPELELLNYPLS